LNKNKVQPIRASNDNVITRFFDKKNLGDLIEDQDGKYAFIIDDAISIELSLDNKYIHMECLLSDLPIKVMTKDRLLSDVAKNSVIDMKHNFVAIYIDAQKKTINSYKNLIIHKTNDENFESELGNFIDISEGYKRLTEKIIRMGELSVLPIEFRLEQ
jgi:hypothetical protein